MFKGSIWETECSIPKRDIPPKNIVVDVAVIGAGMAGILIADRLLSEGLRVVVLEADRIAGGQSGKTTAKITAQHGCVYANFAETFGEEKARLYAKANGQAIEWYRKCVKSRKIDCDFETAEAFVYSLSEIEKLKKEAEVCKKIGIDAEFATKTELPFKIAGAVKFKEQAQFNPIKFLKAISENLFILENTKVKSVSGNAIFCENCTVKAEHIVFACHYPFPILPGLYFTRLYQQRSYVIAFRNAVNIRNMYIGVDTEGYSFRGYKDILLFGGEGHRTGEKSEQNSYENLRKAAKKMFPYAEEIACWSAQDCMTADGMPYIGRFSHCHKNWYVATGFGKWGMTLSSVSADIITDLICGRKNEYEEIFSPCRFSLKAAKGIASEMKYATAGLVKANLTVPVHTLSSVRVGDGGIVRIDGKRVGVYRESEKKYYAVIPKCTHMGCGLEWNNDEKSWDCPCHGSRFDYMGNVIDNPAKINLKHPPEF